MDSGGHSIFNKVVSDETNNAEEKYWSASTRCGEGMGVDGGGFPDRFLGTEGITIQHKTH